MDTYIIKGGKRLTGTVTVSGSKNAALPVLTATLLTDDPCIIRNVPELKDIDSLCAMLNYLGKRISRKEDTVTVLPGKLRYKTAPYEHVKKMRASVLVMGPMLARWKRVKVSLPGGCAIGIRPIQFHLNGFMEMGCTVSMDHGYVVLSTDGLKGKQFSLDYPSVGATENLLMGAVMARGKTVIDNVAQEPEIIDLARCLKRMGARIFGEGTRRIAVQGVDTLQGVDYTVIPDRIEAGTFLIAGAATCGDICLRNAEPEHLNVLIDRLKDAGAECSSAGDEIRIRMSGKLKPVSIETAPHPGFPTDLQAPWVALMAMAPGLSVITESIFEKRFLHVPEMNRMGMHARIQGNSVLVEGVRDLSGAPVMASDLRGGAALVIAGLQAGNTTEISRIYHIDRGYDRLEKKLRGLGARIRRVKR